MGTVSYTMMRQNEEFLPFTINPLIIATSAESVSTYGAFGAPVPASLNGAINTLLVNNVLTTQITPELKSKLSYRYYDFDNNTPELLFNNWVSPTASWRTCAAAAYAPVSSLSISYTKQNAGAELNWRPIRQWNLGAAYGYERYDWTRADVDATNENSGKVFADWKPFSWVTARASWLYRGATLRQLRLSGLCRRSNGRWPNAGAQATRQPIGSSISTTATGTKLSSRSPSMCCGTLRSRRLSACRTTTIKLDQSTEVGLLHDHAWNAGVEVTYVMSPDTTFLFSYMYEHRSQVVSSSRSDNTPPFPAANYYTADVEDKVNTFIVAVDHALIPNKLDLRLGYTTSLATVSQPFVFRQRHRPDQPNRWAISGYQDHLPAARGSREVHLRHDLVRRLGWKGKVTAKLALRLRAQHRRQLAARHPASIHGGAPYCPSHLSSIMTLAGQRQSELQRPRLVASLGYKW